MGRGARRYVLAVVAVTAALTGVSIVLTGVGGGGHRARAVAGRAATTLVVAHSPVRPARSPSLSASNWETIKAAAALRAMALQPGRTAYYRSFAAYMGLSGLVRLHAIPPGPCATAVSYLYDNLLDLHAAYPGEVWTPLRRAVATQPSLQVCASQPVRSALRYSP